VIVFGRKLVGRVVVGRHIAAGVVTVIAYRSANQSDLFDGIGTATPQAAGSQFVRRSAGLTKVRLEVEVTGCIVALTDLHNRPEADGRLAYFNL